ncbi:hypothetical protein ACI6PS_00900 [Flavobacterium sp. PLA-1-15]|uniref:hypothetical protein n=1 Tax=Flavobacterium sp. PLA-1-15 TaxID=3380533 RepID=UPI003B7B4109
MGKKKPSLKMRNEEYSVAGRFVQESFKEDRKELEKLSNEFDVAYENAFDNQLEVVEEMEQGLGITQQQKDATKLLHVKTDEMDKEMNSLSFRLGKIGVDTALVTKAKKQLNSGNVEGACKSVEGLVQLVKERSGELESKGMKKEYPEDLKNRNETMRQLNERQNLHMNAGKGVTEAEKAEYKKLYAFIQNICKAGRIVFDGKAKEDEYTISKLIKRMRAPERKDDEGLTD